MFPLATFLAAAGAVACMVVLRRGPTSAHWRDHARLVRRLRELRSAPGIPVGVDAILIPVPSPIG